MTISHGWMPRRSIKIMFFINLRVTRRKFAMQLTIKTIEETSEWNLLLFNIRDRDQTTRQPNDPAIK
jgi:hypothetical protein